MRDISHQLPRVVMDYFAAHNTPDPEAFAATFAADALVNDARREFVGQAAIRAWADKEIFGDHVKVQVLEGFEHRGGFVVRASYDGDFDKTNLPDPVVLTNYFSVEDGRITQLIILLNKSAWSPTASQASEAFAG